MSISSFWIARASSDRRVPPESIRDLPAGADRRRSSSACPNTRQVLQFSLELLHILRRAFKRRAGRQLQTVTSNSLWSSCGMKFLPTIMNSGTVERIPPRRRHNRPAMTHGPHQHPPYGSETTRKKPESFVCVPSPRRTAQEARAEHRRQREADKQRDHDGERRRITEARHELARQCRPSWPPAGR